MKSSAQIRIDTDAPYGRDVLGNPLNYEDALKNPHPKVEDVLRQRGHRVDLKVLTKPPGGVGDFRSFEKRKKEKLKMEEAVYARLFELIVATTWMEEVGCPAICNVKIKGEGPGGDFDVLATNTGRELFYFECKTGNNIKEKDLDSFFKRHLFLKPDVSVMVFDQSKTRVKGLLPIMRNVLTRYYREKDKIADPKWQFADFETIPEAKEYAYHMNRNLFFCSGENLSRGITHILRHFYGVVKQTSYYS